MENQIGGTTTNAHTNADVTHQRGSADLAATEDHLGLDTYATGIANFITSCATPMTLSIQGDWGSGKTSLFNLIEEKLKTDGGKYNDNIVDVVKVNTWQFSVAGYQEALISVLLSEIMDALPADEQKECENSVIRERILRVVNTLGNALSGRYFNMSLRELTDGSAGGHQSSKVQPEGADKYQCDRYAEIKQLKDDLRVVIQAHGNSSDNPDKRLVVFIDDLDRLEPSCAVSLMEGVKNFMDCEGCVFILAIDEKVVFEGIKQKYGSELGDERKRVFFDKLIQVPFHIPTDAYKVDNYVEDLLTKEPDKIVDAEKDVYKCVVMNLLDGNPRSIKRYFNLTKLYEAIFSETEGKTTRSSAMLLAAVMLIERSRMGDDDVSSVVERLRAGEKLEASEEKSETAKTLETIIGDNESLLEDLGHWLKELQQITPQPSLEGRINGLAQSYGLAPRVDQNNPRALEFCDAEDEKVLKVNNKRDRKQLTITFYKSALPDRLWDVFTEKMTDEYNQRFRYKTSQSYATLITAMNDIDDRNRKIADAVKDYLEQAEQSSNATNE